MATDPKTIREVSHQLAFHAKAFYGIAVLTIAVIGFLFVKADAIEDRLAQLDKKVAVMDTKLDKLLENSEASKASLNAIKKVVLAGNEASPAIIEAVNWNSFMVENEDAVREILNGNSGANNVWIFRPQNSEPVNTSNPQ